jgi:branched-chain amino acid transport system permease protein
VTSFLAFTIVGIVTGSIYALTASGLVVTYVTSGVFNFAHGAMGMVMAFVYWELRYQHHWPAPIALVLVLLVLAPLFGATVERVLFRRLAGAAVETTLVASLGLLLVLLGAATVIWDPTKSRPFPEMFAGHQFKIAGVRVSWQQAIVVFTAIAAAALLRFLFRRTTIGVAMRAVVDNRDLTGLSGVSAATVSQLSWALGTMLAALAGILVASQVSLDPFVLTFLVVNGYASAMVGRLRSLPLTFAGGLALGLVESYAIGYLSTGGATWLTRLKPSLPTVFLIGALLLVPEARLRTAQAITARTPRIPSPRNALIAAAVFVAGAWVLSGTLSTGNLANAGNGVALGLLMLSVVLLTGYSGQISLCQFTFAGLGAFAMGKAAGGGSPLGLLVAILITAPLGVLVALPALRLRGLYFALFTLSFALFADSVIFQDRHVFDFGGRLLVPRLRLFGYSFAGERATFMLIVVVFAAAAVGLLVVRRGPIGRRLAAMRDSQAACATLGLNLTITRLAVFTTAAAMAGVAGALYGSLRSSVGASDFVMLNSLMLLLLATVGGVATVSGALLGGIAFAMFPVIQAHVPWLRALSFLGAGLGVLSLGRNPNGAIGALAESFDRLRARRPRSGNAAATSARPLAPPEVEVELAR